MANIIYRGSACRIRFRPFGDISIDDLGTPSIGIYQENMFLTPDVVIVDTDNNCIYADLTEEDTLLLADGLETTCQAVYRTQDGTVYRFPVHNLEVKRTLFWTVTEDEPLEEIQE